MMKVWLFILGLIIAALSFILSEVIFRRRIVRIKHEGSSEVTLRDILLSIIELRRDIWQLRKDVWQSEMMFFGLLLATLALLL